MSKESADKPEIPFPEFKTKPAPSKVWTGEPLEINLPVMELHPETGFKFTITEPPKEFHFSFTKNEEDIYNIAKYVQTSSSLKRKANRDNTISLPVINKRKNN